MTTCPKCGNKWALDVQHMVFYPWASKEESDRKNYAGSRCQICGYRWNKYQSLSEKAKDNGNNV